MYISVKCTYNLAQKPRVYALKMTYIGVWDVSRWDEDITKICI